MNIEDCYDYADVIELIEERDQRIAALESENERLKEVIKRIDEVVPHADETCDEPGITLSEAVRREMERKEVDDGTGNN